MLRPSRRIVILSVLLSIFAYCPQVEAGGSDGRTRLITRLTGATRASGSAKYEATAARRKFSVEVERTLPTTVHTITISRSGVQIGLFTISSNALGQFDLNRDTSLRQSVHVLRSGDVVTVSAAGRLVVSGRL